MGFIILTGFLLGLACSLAGGILILASPTFQKQPTRKQWGRSSAICLLFSGVLALIASMQFLTARANQASMLHSYQQAHVGVVALGGCMGFGLTGLLGVLLLLITHLAQKPRSRQQCPTQ